MRRSYGKNSGQTQGIWTFEDWIFQISSYPVVGFVCQMPLLKKNRRQFLSSVTVIKLAYIRGTLTLIHKATNWLIG